MNRQKKVPLPAQILIWLVAILAVGLFTVYSFWTYQTRPMTGSDSVYEEQFKVPGGMSVREAGDYLQAHKFIRSSKLFYLAARFNIYRSQGGFSLKSGSYSLRSDMSFREICMVLQSGAPEYVTISIPEGLTISKTAKLFEEAGICTARSFIDACHSERIILAHNIPARSLEGYLFPDTYFFSPDMDAEQVVERLCGTFFEKIGQIDEFKGLEPEELHRKLTLASIVEREYRQASEAPLIASVFTNRLEHNIGLYSCATVEYIITEIEGKPHPERITYQDLKYESPYNTYRWAGLPPGPISNPGLISLKAVASPADTEYFYFVLTDPEAGTHTFSKTFDQHKAAENVGPTKK